MKNYRPVSNLSFLSKVLEKVVVNQLSTRSLHCVTEWRRFLLALFRSDLVKQIFNDQTSKVQLFTEFITDMLYVHEVSSL